MCTCMSLTAQHHFFGRTLDHDHDHTSPVVIAPRRMPLPFRRAGTLNSHYAMIGTAAVMNEVNWVMVASGALLAGVLSMLTSVAGLPEVKSEPIELEE